ncbi:hypothetical protein MUG91_G243n10, partial [Manis pentadactyla]
FFSSCTCPKLQYVNTFFVPHLVAWQKETPFFSEKLTSLWHRFDIQLRSAEWITGVLSTQFSYPQPIQWRRDRENCL